MELNDFTDKQLRTELEKRKLPKPSLLKSIDQSKLIKLCQSYIDQLDHNGSEDDDSEHYIFEAAIEMLFGKTAWKWINKNGQ